MGWIGLIPLSSLPACCCFAHVLFASLFRVLALARELPSECPRPKIAMLRCYQDSLMRNGMCKSLQDCQ